MYGSLDSSPAHRAEEPPHSSMSNIHQGYSCLVDLSLQDSSDPESLRAAVRAHLTGGGVAPSALEVQEIADSYREIMRTAWARGLPVPDPRRPLRTPCLSRLRCLSDFLCRSPRTLCGRATRWFLCSLSALFCQEWLTFALCSFLQSHHLDCHSLALRFWDCVENFCQQPVAPVPHLRPDEVV